MSSRKPVVVAAAAALGVALLGGLMARAATPPELGIDYRTGDYRGMPGHDLPAFCQALSEQCDRDRGEYPLK